MLVDFSETSRVMAQYFGKMPDKISLYKKQCIPDIETNKSKNQQIDILAM